ncbi:MAG: hypothetical protein LBH31_05280 [Burkholderiaceae bacterium]|jgi:hypothetical protein|nr:hypothetical protein [Burkholderiaceae bacterium]
MKALTCNLNLSASNPNACLDEVAKAANFAGPPPPVDTSATRGSSGGVMTALGRGLGAAYSFPTIISRSVEWIMAYFHMTSALQMLQALILMCIYMLATHDRAFQRLQTRSDVVWRHGHFYRQVLDHLMVHRPMDRQ